MPLSRRNLLIVLGSALVTAPTGCTLLDGGTATPRATPAPPPPDPLLPALVAENTMLVLYDNVLARYPQLAARLAPIRADHAAHLDALRAVVRGAPAGRPSPSASAAPTPAAVPSTAAAAIVTLRAAELAASRLLSLACVTAPVDRAALLGSIAACESAHLVLVR
ncbi:MAG: hypothetical protein ABIM89_04250 [Mycobacteriales bacterium]